MNPTERIFLEAECAQLRRLIATAPPVAIVEKFGFEQRLQRFEQMLAEAPDEPKDRNTMTRLEFELLKSQRSQLLEMLAELPSDAEFVVRMSLEAQLEEVERLLRRVQNERITSETE